MIWLSIIAQQSGRDIISGLPYEQVFGGAVLVFLLSLILMGKLRLEREVQREERINAVHEETIQQQRDTIRTLTKRERETLHLLRELRTAAIARGDIQFSNMVPQEELDNDVDL